MLNLSRVFFTLLFFFSLSLDSISYESNVSVYKIKERTKLPTIKITSNAMALKEYIIRSEVEGKVNNILKDEGENVLENETFATIENSKYNFALKNSQEMLYAAEAELKLSNLRLKRFNSLFEKRIISQQELDQALYSEQNLLSKFNSQFEILKKSKLDYENCNIKSKFDGTISRKYVKEGDYIEIGTPLFQITNNRIIEIRIFVTDAYINKIDEGTKVVLNPKNSKAINSKITKVIRRIDSTSGTFLAKIYIKNNETITPGEQIEVEIELFIDSNYLEINKDAVINSDKGKFVYKVVRDKVLIVPIEIIEDQEENFLVLSKLQIGDLIVVEGNERLIPNQKVKVIANVN
mgnify:FL=1